MKNFTRPLLAITLAGASLFVAAALQANPTQSGAASQHRSGENMSGRSMMGEGSGPMTREGAGGMREMMPQMNRMMKSCNEMMDSHAGENRDANEQRSPTG